MINALTSAPTRGREDRTAGEKLSDVMVPANTVLCDSIRKVRNCWQDRLVRKLTGMTCAYPN